MPLGPSPAESISYRPLPQIPGASLLSVKNSTKLWRVYHETYSICTVLPETSAMAEWQYRGKTYESPARSMQIIEPGEVHRMQRIVGNGTGTFDVILLNPSAMHEISQSMGLRPQPHLSVASLWDVGTCDSFMRLLRKFTGKSGQLEVESLFVGCISRLIGHCSEKKPAVSPLPSYKSLLKAREFLQENYNKAVSLQELADLTGLSRFHLLRGFCQVFGLPPHAYQIKIRISKAQHILEKSPQVSDVDLGFSDQSHFIRHFKKSLGVTPHQYFQMMKSPFSGASH